MTRAGMRKVSKLLSICGGTLDRQLGEFVKKKLLTARRAHYGKSSSVGIFQPHDQYGSLGKLDVVIPQRFERAQAN